jgi:hypothetical protein
MNKHMETLMVQDEPRLAVRHRRIQPRYARRLSRLLPRVKRNGEATASKPRFEIDSIAPVSKSANQKSTMRVLLRNAKTMKFLGPGERWTNDSSQARDFRNGWWATVFAFTLNPRQLVIHYEFDDDRYDLHIPVLGHARGAGT